MADGVRHREEDFRREDHILACLVAKLNGTRGVLNIQRHSRTNERVELRSIGIGLVVILKDGINFN